VARISQCFVAIAVVTFCGVLCAQSARSIIVSPASATMLVGESRPFRAVDDSGTFLHNVEWTVSQSSIVEVSSGDEVEVTAQRPGKVTLTARTSSGSADAHIEVVEGRTLPYGTAKWTSEDLPGCQSTKITPAVPTANGPDVFAENQCPDGTYLRAYTADGILLWRRKIGSNGGMPAKSVTPAVVVTNRLNTRAQSICDSVSVGMKERAVRELLKGRNLEAPATGQKTWVLEEESAQCKLWFDAASDVAKKRKTLTAE
jgi:hypothetical protein